MGLLPRRVRRGGEGSSRWQRRISAAGSRTRTPLRKGPGQVGDNPGRSVTSAAASTTPRGTSQAGRMRGLRAAWAMARAIAASRNVFAPSIRVIAWYTAPAVTDPPGPGTSPRNNHVPRASCAHETPAAAIPKAAAACPARACPRRRAARATDITTAARAIAATPSFRTNWARAGPLCPAKAVTTCLPVAATAGFGAPTARLMIQAAVADTRQCGQADSHTATPDGPSGWTQSERSSCFSFVL